MAARTSTWIKRRPVLAFYARPPGREKGSCHDSTG